MEAMAKIFVFLFLCRLCIGGNASSNQQCKVSDLKVTQTDVPAHAVGGYPVYEVSVENRCVCSQANVKVKCYGFNASVPIDPEGLLSPDAGGELCTLNGGRPIPAGAEHAVTFFYAWGSRFSFEPVSSTLACSAAAPASAPASASAPL